jgi:hypothetical protein
MPRIRAARLAAALVGVAGLLAACSQSAPQSFPPLRYGYLTPLPLNVQTIEIDPRFVPAGEDTMNDQDPAPPVQVLTDMAHDRLQAVGGTGRAVFVIKDASIVRDGDTLTGNMDVELDVYGGGGTRAGFAEARVTRTRTGDLGDIQSALYQMTSQMMDAMNIEFEYQVRRSLRDWILAPGATQAPVSQQPLAPPPGTPLAPPSGLTPPAGGAPPGMSPPPTTMSPPPTTLSPPPTTLAPPAAAASPYGATPPAYQAPAYQAPTSQAPAYQPPAYQQPAYQPPTYPQPAYPQPAYPQPAYPQPAYPPPTYPTPAYPAPAYPAPSGGLAQPVPLVPPTQP